MTKSTVVVFILGFSILFKLEKPRCSLIVIVLFIATGLFMFTFEATEFNLEGFLMVLGASFLSGMRWTLSQLVLQKKEIGLSNPVDMMYHIQPWMMLAMMPLSAGFEGVHIATSQYAFGWDNSPEFVKHMGLLLVGALLAFFMEGAEFLLVMNTSSLTLSVAGIFKEICTLGLAAGLNGDQMSSMNLIGLCVCLSGIILHVIIKAVNMREESLQARPLDESVEMLLQDGHANNDDEDEEIDIFNAHRDR